MAKVLSVNLCEHKPSAIDYTCRLDGRAWCRSPSELTKTYRSCFVPSTTLTKCFTKPIKIFYCSILGLWQITKTVWSWNRLKLMVFLSVFPSFTKNMMVVLVPRRPCKYLRRISLGMQLITHSTRFCYVFLFGHFISSTYIFRLKCCATVNDGDWFTSSNFVLVLVLVWSNLGKSRGLSNSRLQVLCHITFNSCHLSIIL